MSVVKIGSILAGLAAMVLAVAPADAQDGKKLPADVINAIPKDVRDRGVIRVGSQQTFPPVEFREDGKPAVTGVSVDLLTEIGKRLGLKIEYIHAEYAALIGGVEAGRFDIASGGISDTEEREQKLDFVNYMKSGGSILLLADNKDRLDTIADFCGKKVATLLGSRVIMDAVEKASAECVSKGKPAIEAAQLPSAPDARMQLDLKRVQGYLGDYPALVYLGTLFKGKYRIAGGNYVLTPYITSWGFGKDKQGLRNAVQKAAESMRADGTYVAIMKKWGVDGGALPQISVNLPANKRG